MSIFVIISVSSVVKKTSTMAPIINICLISVLMIVSDGCEARSVDNDSRDTASRRPVPFNLEEIYEGDYYLSEFNGTWISPNEIMYKEKTVGIVKYNIETRKITTILPPDILRNYKMIYTYTLSADHSHILIGYAPQAKFRHSVVGKHVVFDLKTRKPEYIANGDRILMAEWSPAGNGLIYETNNDLYYREITGNGSVVTRRLTTDGVVGVIYNGLPDWVYEEEVPGGSTRFWFSPDGKHFAFVSFNDTEVPDVSYFYYGPPGDIKYQYPRLVKIKYPKVGTTNPRVSLNLVDLTDPNSNLLSLRAPIDVVSQDHIIHQVNWLTNDSVAAFWTNRVQNIAQLVTYDVHGKPNYLLKIEEKEGWIDVPKPIQSGNKLFLLKYQETNTTDGRYNHVTSYDLINGSVLTNEKDLTPLASEVQSLLRIDENGQKIYYLAAEPGEPSQRNLYSTPIDGSKRPSCISCNVLTPEGNNCTYVDAKFSTDASHYVLSCTGPDPTTIEVYNIQYKKVYSWQMNESLRSKLKGRLQPTQKNISIRINGHVSKARMMLPPGFNESLSYPMIVHVYAGPNTVSIKDNLPISYHSYYTTNRSVIWTEIDGRGSAFKGSKMLFEIYRRIGTVEIEDQIEMTKKLQTTYSWIDSKRTGIWGWSYGGFATAMVMATDHEKIFKCGISVAPVSSWIYYDSIYTERYMGLPTPEDNEAGYNRTDVSRLVEGMRGKKYMLIHGTSDDNVHYQQSMALSRSLALADIQFEQISYADESHGLNGVNPHLRHALDHFWSDCLNLTYAK